jgi:hypothetical protein
MAKMALDSGKTPLIIIDDVGADSYMKRGDSKTNIVNFLAKQASHFNVELFTLFQRFTQAPVTLRDQADTVTLFSTSSKPELTLYQQSYFGMMDPKTFRRRWYQVFRMPYDTLTIVNLKGGMREFMRNGKKFVFNQMV